MKGAEKGALGFLVAVIIVGAGALFVPSVQQGTSSVGISGALGMPGWALVAFVIAAAVGGIGILLANAHRRKNGRPPL